MVLILSMAFQGCGVHSIQVICGLNSIQSRNSQDMENPKSIQTQVDSASQT
jgi:hypothetical protein